MRSREFLAWSIVSILFGFAVTSVYTSKKQKVEITENEIKHLKDSLESEYYKKQLDSYPFDHSKIPQ